MVSRTLLFAGRAQFTITGRSGEQVHVKVKRAPANVDFTGKPFPPSFYVTLAEVSAEFDVAAPKYVGVLTVDGALKTTGKSMYRLDARPVRILRWALDLILADQAPPDGYQFTPGPFCGKCGKPIHSMNETGLCVNCEGEMI